MTEEVKEKELSVELLAAADAAKEEGWDVALTSIAGQDYVFRAVTRKEWRELLTQRNEKLSAVEEGEEAKMVEIQEDEMEKLVELCLVFPKREVSKLRAGVIQTLSDQILYESGFGGPEMEPKRL